MRNFIYGIIGIFLGIIFIVFIVNNNNKIDLPSNTNYLTESSSTNDKQVAILNTDNIPTYITTDEQLKANEIPTYIITDEMLKKYEKDKIIEFGKSDPMFYSNIKESMPESLPASTSSNSKNNQSSGLNQNSIDPNAIVGDSDYNVDSSVMKFNLDDSSNNYALPVGYLFGYNTTSKKLNIVDISSIELDILNGSSLPVDKVYYQVSSSFGMRKDPLNDSLKEFHKGLDISSKDILGKNVYAMLDGTIETAQKNDSYGNYVVINHGKYSTLYAHLQGFVKNIKVGNKVKSGDIIGYVGATGDTTGPHLHIEFDINSITLNPKYFLNLVLLNKTQVVK